MNSFRRYCRHWTLPLALLLVLTANPATEVAATEEDRQRLQEFVGREDVRNRMEALGLDPDEAAARLGDLSDAEARRIASYVEEEPAGQGALAILLGAILFILVVLVITDLLGVTRVFPFVRARR